MADRERTFVLGVRCAGCRKLLNLSRESSLTFGSIHVIVEAHDCTPVLEGRDG